VLLSSPERIGAGADTSSHDYLTIPECDIQVPSKLQGDPTPESITEGSAAPFYELALHVMYSLP
jgi:hypothetical protein